MTSSTRTRRTIGSLLLTTGVLAGCGLGDGNAPADVTKDTPLTEAVDVASLHENRTPYLGDNSRVIALVDAVHPEAVGPRTLGLETDEPPYALTIEFSSLAPGVTGEVAADLMAERAALLLATIGNASEVRWVLPEDGGQPAGGSLTREEADALAGSSVAELGTTPMDLTDLVDQLGS